MAAGGTGGSANGAAGTIFIKTPGTNGTLIVDNNNLVTTLYANIAAGDYTGLFDQIQLNLKGNLWLPITSTVTVSATNIILGDGTTGYLRVDGTLSLPVTYTQSGYGIVWSSMTTLAGVTSWTVGGTSGAVVTHEYNSTTEVHKTSFPTVTNLTVASNGQINVLGRGYVGGQGPGKPLCNFSGGSYGGGGGSESGCSGPAYGSYNAPVNIGSGGGDSSGGGAVILNVTNNLTLNGSISAQGTSSGNSGSGGSIFLTVSSLLGNGSLNASGGSNNRGGSGGRIAVIGSTASFTGTWLAAGGTGGSANGGPGTIFIQSPGKTGTLIVDNNNISSLQFANVPAGDYSSLATYFDLIQLNHMGGLWFAQPSTVTLTATDFLGDGTTGYLKVDGALNLPATYTMSGYGLMVSTLTSLSVTSLTVGGSSGAVITNPYNGSTEIYKTSFTVTNLTVASNGQINVLGRGYAANQGPGKPPCNFSGGGYGGGGGSESGCSGPAYGSYSAPVNIGSGGGDSSGGGAVILNVTNNLTLNGSISAQGDVQRKLRLRRQYLLNR